MSSHPENAARFLADRRRAAWHDQTLWQVRQRRDIWARELPEWERLTELAADIKGHTLGELERYLKEFVDKARGQGATVHFAADANEHNEIVHGLLAARSVKRVVKSKSMLTEECGLNDHLERCGIEVVDTDLGERIVQLRREPPSHIVLPAIHLKREDVGETFRQRLGTAASSDPVYLTRAARKHLRSKFLRAEAGITGVNFAVAETGGIVVCTNEGNADLGAVLPPLHIACMGIEKLVPRQRDLGVFLRLLARSATGQALTSYTSHFHGPRPGGELHVVLVDNGRTEILADDTHRSALGCIRCGACMNTCPVYRKSGGHSYEAHVPGPIGSILAPLRSPEHHASLPHACTLCGSCRFVCPVRIELDHQLLALRRRLHDAGHVQARKRWAARMVAWVLARPRSYRAFAWLARIVGPRRWPRFGSRSLAGRQLPVLAPRSFQRLYRERRGDD